MWWRMLLLFLTLVLISPADLAARAQALLQSKTGLTTEPGTKRRKVEPESPVDYKKRFTAKQLKKIAGYGIRISRELALGEYTSLEQTAIIQALPLNVTSWQSAYGGLYVNSSDRRSNYPANGMSILLLHCDMVIC
jgi:hypothetical protein